MRLGQFAQAGKKCHGRFEAVELPGFVNALHVVIQRPGTEVSQATMYFGEIEWLVLHDLALARSRMATCRV